MAQDHTPLWRLDRRLTLSALATGVSSLVMASALIAGLSTRVEHLESRAGTLDAEARNARGIAIGMARMEERLEALQRTLEELRGEVRHLSRAAPSVKAGTAGFIPEDRPGVAVRAWSRAWLSFLPAAVVGPEWPGAEHTPLEEGAP